MQLVEDLGPRGHCGSCTKSSQFLTRESHLSGPLPTTPMSHLAKFSERRDDKIIQPVLDYRQLIQLEYHVHFDQ